MRPAKRSLRGASNRSVERLASAASRDEATPRDVWPVFLAVCPAGCLSGGLADCLAGSVTVWLSSCLSVCMAV